MKKVLITGATGNTGREVINALDKIEHKLDIYAGVRDINVKAFVPSDKIKLREFDFTDFNTYQTALASCDILFLLRPPQVSNVEKYFKPIIDICKVEQVKHIIFLSVQGVEKSKSIPHHKIEKLIVESKIPYTFLRPAYFMQNFTSTLRNDLVYKKRIYLPAGNALFTLIDVRDIGSVAAIIMTNVSKHINATYELTCKEKLSFLDMAKTLSHVLHSDIHYHSPNLFSFIIAKRKEKIPTMLILVMIMLHYFPRFQKAPQISEWVETITNKQPISFRQFVLDNENILKTGSNSSIVI